MIIGYLSYFLLASTYLLTDYECICHQMFHKYCSSRDGVQFEYLKIGL